MSLRAIQRTFICLLAQLGAVLLPAAALAVDNLSITIATTPIALGKIVRSNSAATTFTVTNAGAVSVTSGAGVRVTTGTVSALSLSLDCRQDATTTKCTAGSKTYTLTVTAGSSSGGDTLNKFSYGSIGSTGSLVGSAPAAANPLSFQLQVKPGQTWPITVTLGYEFGVSTTATRGSASAPYTVTLTEN